MSFDLNQAIRDLFGSADPTDKPKKGKEVKERVCACACQQRDRYQEGLITELLRTLAATGAITKDEAQAIIRRAKEYAK